MALWPFVAVAAVGFGLSACSGPSAPTLGPKPTREVQSTQTAQVKKPEPSSEILAKGAELYADCTRPTARCATATATA